MSRHALLAALEEEIARQLDERRAAAAHEAAQLRQAAGEACAARLAVVTAQGASAANDLHRRLLAAARREAQQLTLAAETELAERLRRLAAQLLPELAERCPQGCLRALLAELPPLAWAELRVHPRDVAWAQELFPAAQLVTEPAISGGVLACSAGQRIVVDNTLEKRLERGWDELLPRLFAALEVDYAGTVTPP